ncbi:hypothetical protein [Sphingobium sp. HWE2-09]|uniref:hypothetical protein n=1 Tax=Sphingobium sp. HWE2-09 TaxID=3108390 RepID=UPI002DD068E1|nr:hypothetical protein [Sphingobium sp. HWE2-09]
MSLAIRNLVRGGSGSTEENAAIDNRRIIDISMRISNDVITDPAMPRPRIKYSVHVDGALQMLPFFPGLTVDDLPDREGWASEVVRSARIAVVTWTLHGIARFISGSSGEAGLSSF